MSNRSFLRAIGFFIGIPPLVEISNLVKITVVRKNTMFSNQFEITFATMKISNIVWDSAVYNLSIVEMFEYVVLAVLFSYPFN